MAEIGIAASIIGIASAGIKLTTSLYEFGSTVSSAREQTDYVAKNVTLYSQVLELLGERLDDDKPIHSRKALVLACELCEQSHALFDKIQDLLPDQRRCHNQLSWLQKVAWNFRKSRVNLLVGELEYLKSTVQLLVQVLFTGRRIRAFREDFSKTNEKRDAIHSQCMRTRHAIIERHLAQEQLPLLLEAAEREEMLSIKPATSPYTSSKVVGNLAGPMVKVQEATLALIDASAAAMKGSDIEKRALVLQKTARWLQQLLETWTVLPEDTADLPDSAASITGTENGSVHVESQPPQATATGSSLPKRYTRPNINSGRSERPQEINLSDAAPPMKRRVPNPPTTDMNSGPWEPPRQNQKEWTSPTRRKADDQWVREHEERQKYLEVMSQELRGPLSPPIIDSTSAPSHQNWKEATGRSARGKIPDKYQKASVSDYSSNDSTTRGQNDPRQGQRHFVDLGTYGDDVDERHVAQYNPRQYRYDRDPKKESSITNDWRSEEGQSKEEQWQLRERQLEDRQFKAQLFRERRLEDRQLEARLFRERRLAERR